MNHKRYSVVLLLIFCINQSILSQVEIDIECNTIVTSLNSYEFPEKSVQVLLERQLSKGIWYRDNSQEGSTQKTYKFSNLLEGQYRTVYLLKNVRQYSNLVEVNLKKCQVNSEVSKQIRTFPNPTNNLLNFNVEVQEVIIYHIQSNIPLIKDSNVSSLDVSHLNSGVYRVEIKNADSSTQSLKIVKI